MTEELVDINNKVFIIYRENIERDYIRYRVVNSSGQTVELTISMFFEYAHKHQRLWTACLSVNKKSRGYEYGKVTGRAGIESLMLAKKMLKHFIDHMDSRFSNYLYIWGDDRKRLNVYEWGLKDLGFSIVNNNLGKKYKSGKCLLKVI